MLLWVVKPILAQAMTKPGANEPWLSLFSVNSRTSEIVSSHK